MRFPIARKTQVQNTQDAVLKSTDTSLDSRCNMGMKWVDPLDPLDRLTKLPHSCSCCLRAVRTSSEYRLGLREIYIYIAGNHGFSPENVMMVLGYGSLNPDASHVHSWLILKYLEVLAKLKYTGLS